MPHDLMDVVLEGKEPPSCDKTLNIVIMQANTGTAHAKWEPDERFLNGVGVVMGGFVSSAADITMAYAVSSLLNENQSFGSINLNVTFHRAIAPGTVLVEARVEKIGRTIAYVVANLKQNDKIAASAVSSVMIRER